MAKSYKVEIKVRGEMTYCSNGLRFKTCNEALEYGENLAMRWTAVDLWRVAPSDDEPNQPEVEKE